MPVYRGYLNSELPDDVAHVHIDTIRYRRAQRGERDVQNAMGTGDDRAWRRLRFAAAVESDLDVTPASVQQEIGDVHVPVDGMPPATLVDGRTSLGQLVEIQHDVSRKGRGVRVGPPIVGHVAPSPRLRSRR